jgi:putative ABC transport system ATP-binding protein
VSLLGHDLAQLNETARAILRREQVGILFQNAHLFPLLTAQENTELPLRLARTDPKQRAAQALAALAMVNLTPRAQHRGLELSGGEQQRVALARALAHHPRFVVADEPTGNLDSTTGREIAALLLRIVHEQGIGMLIATHDNAVVSIADRVLTISDGQLI